MQANRTEAKLQTNCWGSILYKELMDREQVKQVYPARVYQKVLDENDKTLKQGRSRKNGQVGEVKET